MQRKKSLFKGKMRRHLQNQEQKDSSYGYLAVPKDVNIFTAPPDKTVHMDILPYKVTDTDHPDKIEADNIAMPGSFWYRRPFTIHRNIGSQDEKVVCLKSIGQRCPICDYRSKRFRDGAPREETDKLRPGKRVLYAINIKEAEGATSGIHLWDIAYTLFEDLLQQEISEKEYAEAFADIEGGYTLRVRFASKVIGTGQPFAETSRIDFEERDKDYTSDILTKVPNLDKVLQILSAKELEAKFFDLDSADVTTEDEEEVKPEPEIQEERDVPVRKRKTVEPDEEQLGGEDEEKQEEKTCPQGYNYAVDVDKYPECKNCTLWGSCTYDSE